MYLFAEVELVLLKMHSQYISLKTRLRLTKCYVWSLLTYACDTWTLSKQMEANIEAFEMWLYRRIMRISWKEIKSNAEVLKMIGLKNKELVLSIKKKKLAYYGHARRHHSLQKLVLEGKVGGKRGRGRRRKTGNVSEITKMSMAQCSVKALDRSEWCTMVSNLYAETELRLIDLYPTAHSCFLLASCVLA